MSTVLRSALSGLGLLVVIGSGPEAKADFYKWTDWQSSDSTAGFTAQGQIVTDTTTVDVTYNNPLGVSFFQSGSGTDYFTNGTSVRDPATSPYTSSVVDNIPPAAEMIALNRAGTQSLTFSEAIANPVFAYVSLNGNGYAFDQDFEILSFGDATNGNDPGYWGAGTSFKNVVDLGGGAFEYQLLGTGEPHGTLRFLGAFDTLNWRSLSNENWNGFTVGILSTEDERIPEPAALTLLFVASLAGVGGRGGRTPTLP